MKLLVLIILFLLLSFNAYADLIITEILANPIQNDNYNEYVEIYNDDNSFINLENLTLCNNKLESGYINKQDLKTYNNLSLTINPKSYALITDGGTGTEVYTNFNPKGIALHTDSSSLCGGLSNSGKEVSLYLNGIKISSVTYPVAQEGLSWSLVNGNWLNSNTTPGDVNFIIPNESNISNQSMSLNITINNTTNLSNQQNTTNNGVNLSNQFQDNETVDCDWQVLILTNKTIFSNSSEVKWKIIIFRNKGYRANISFKRFITDNKGNLIKNYETLNLSVENKRNFAYSPNLDPGFYIINTQITTGCNDINLSNNKDSLSIQVNGSELSEPLEEITINEDPGDLKANKIKTIKKIENKTETNLNPSFGSITGKTIYDKQSIGSKKAIYIFVASIILLIAYFIYKGKNGRTKNNLEDDSGDSWSP